MDALPKGLGQSKLQLPAKGHLNQRCPKNAGKEFKVAWMHKRVSRKGCETENCSRENARNGDRARSKQTRPERERLLKNADRSELRSQWIGRLHRLQLAARADLRADQLEELSNSMIIGIYHLYVRVLPYKDIYRTTSYVYGV